MRATAAFMRATAATVRTMRAMTVAMRAVTATMLAAAATICVMVRHHARHHARHGTYFLDLRVENRYFFRVRRQFLAFDRFCSDNYAFRVDLSGWQMFPCRLCTATRV